MEDKRAQHVFRGELLRKTGASDAPRCAGRRPSGRTLPSTSILFSRPDSLPCILGYQRLTFGVFTSFWRAKGQLSQPIPVCHEQDLPHANISRSTRVMLNST